MRENQLRWRLIRHAGQKDGHGRTRRIWLRFCVQFRSRKAGQKGKKKQKINKWKKWDILTVQGQAGQTDHCICYFAHFIFTHWSLSRAETRVSLSFVWTKSAHQLNIHIAGHSSVKLYRNDRLPSPGMSATRRVPMECTTRHKAP